jgi:hypothetical protein
VHVGKQELVRTLEGTLNSGTLHLPPDASDLVAELQNYEVRTSEAGRDSYGALKRVLTTTKLPHWRCRCGPARLGGRVPTDSCGSHLKNVSEIILDSGFGNLSASTFRFLTFKDHRRSRFQSTAIHHIMSDGMKSALDIRMVKTNSHIHYLD